MNQRLKRLIGISGTMRKMEDVANAEVLARRDEQQRARARARHAHASAAASRAESGSVYAFLASLQRADAHAAAADDADVAVDQAAAAVTDAEVELVAAKVRTASFDRLVANARAQAQAALDAADLRTIEDTVAARAARENNQPS